MDQSLTVVLPVYNCERQLRSSVMDILDLDPAQSHAVKIVVVDNGSTDDTYETACELARTYPQITVLRQSVQQGLSAALDLVRDRIAVDKVVVHDGVSPIDAAQLQNLLYDGANKETNNIATSTASTARESSGSRRFAAVRALHNRMEVAHQSTISFRWIHLEKPLIPRRRQVPAAPSNSPATPTATPTIGLPIELANLPMGINSLPPT